ncbi:SRPBCC family protein [Rathayibacter soli]|uniref:SRPBCC family protein n=1 Tax=Rathayibacter soli TaxID=3144168 RepID=UPI0027E57654|nr:SRPBCC domain-containing protein [Glaciibacter superstes]
MAEFRTSIDIDATPETVFAYLVTPDGMLTWMGERAVLDAQPDGRFEVDIAGYPIRGRYLEVEPPHRVTVSWGIAGSDDLPPGCSRVTFALTAIASGTRVDLLHTDLPEQRAAGHAVGWHHFLDRLALAASGQPVGVDSWTPQHSET